jgi:hypothetical protein
MNPINCWEYIRCGRELGGNNTTESGVCPASTHTLADGFLGGVNGGRACYFIMGTLCCGEVDLNIDKNSKNCTKCSFREKLQKKHAHILKQTIYNRYINNALNMSHNSGRM